MPTNTRPLIAVIALIFISILMAFSTGCSDEDAEQAKREEDARKDEARKRHAEKNQAKIAKLEAERKAREKKPEPKVAVTGKKTPVPGSNPATTTAPAKKETSRESSIRLKREAAEKRLAAALLVKKRRQEAARLKKPPSILETKIGKDPYLQKIKALTLAAKEYEDLPPHKQKAQKQAIIDKQAAIIDEISKLRFAIQVGHGDNALKIDFDSGNNCYNVSGSRGLFFCLRSDQYQWLPGRTAPLLDTAMSTAVVKSIAFLPSENDKIAKLIPTIKKKLETLKRYSFTLQVKAAPKVFVNKTFGIWFMYLVDAELMAGPVYPVAGSGVKVDPHTLAPPTKIIDPVAVVKRSKPVAVKSSKMRFNGDTTKVTKPASPVTWETAAWSPIMLNSTHPMAKACDLTLKKNNMQVVAGVRFGGEAKTKEDAGYKQFEKAQFDIFTQGMQQSGKLVTINKAKHTIGGIEFLRMIVTQRGQLATVCVGIQDDRCVSYWYIGTPDLFGTFKLIAGKAKYKKP